MSALDGRSGGSQYPRGAVVFEAALNNGATNGWAELVGLISVY